MSDEPITRERLRQFRALEGCRVTVSLRDGSRVDGCELVSIGRQGTGTVWLVVDGVDRFVAFDEIRDIRAANKSLTRAA